MSEELNDEVEAINSIFGDHTLSQSTDDALIFVLHLPNASALRLCFPPNYPSSAPEVLSTHSSSGGVKGAGARDLILFRDAVAAVFQEGVVCLFEALEEFERRLGEVIEAEAAAAALDEGEAEEDGQEEGTNSGRRHRKEDDEIDITAMDPPPWTLSDPVIDTKSTFLARVAPVSSPQQAHAYLAHLLATDRRARSATHNITAWRIRGPEGSGSGGTVSFQDCDDDGEAAAGSRVLHLMQVMEVWGAMVVVTRWYGGVKLGPRRFAVINAVARDGFVKAGLVREGKKGKN